MANEILPFGLGAESNVMTQAEYEALAARSSGFSSGVAKSEQLNKVWRQSSFMASVLADFIAAQSGNDVLDNGNTATLLASLELAIKEYANSNLPVASTLQQGITKLSSLTNSSSETLAATLKAVKTVSDEGLKITGNLAEIKAAGPAAIAEAQSNLDLAALLGDALQKANNLSEIKDAGPAAVAQTLLNLGLGDAAKRTIGTGSANVPDIAIADARYKSIGYTPVLSRVWVSNEYMPVTGTPTIVNHGLTGIDVLHCKADVLLKCIAADLAGYSPGDFAAGWGIHYNNAPLSPIPALSTSTITISSGNAGTGILVSGKGGGPSYAIDTTKWRLIFRIFY